MRDNQFWKLLEPIHQSAAAFCLKLTGDIDEAGDLYHDSLLIAWRKLHGLNDHSAFRPWLFRILINNYKNRCRSFWKRHRVPLTQELTDKISGQDSQKLLDTRRNLINLLATLKPEDRALVILHDVDGWSVGELADMNNRPEGTIKTRLFRARQKMRKAMEKRFSAKCIDLSTSEAVYAVPKSKTTDR